MTDLPPYPGTVDLTALFEIVSPGTAKDGVNYSITLSKLALLINETIFAPTFVTSGSTYNSVSSDTRILVNKTIGSPTSIVLLGAASYLQPVLIKDIKGDAFTNNITVSFAGTYDGIASPLRITTNYGWIWMNPLPNGNFYET